MVLEPLEISNGILMLILDTISIAVGLLIISKYFGHERKFKALLYVGLAWIFMVSPWYSGALSFIIVLVTGEYLSAEAYMIIGNIFIPIALVLWLAAFTELVYKKGQKLIVLIFCIYGVIFCLIFFILLALDPLLIGTVRGIDVKYNTFIAVYYLTLEGIILITGYLFTKQSLRSENPEIRLKGKFLMLAFILFVIGSTLNALLALDYVTLVIFRGFEIASSVSFYLGFILPEPIKKIFIKNVQK